MQTIPRPAAASPIWLGCLLTGALALGTASATALSTGTAGTAGATSGKQVTVSVETVGKDKILVASGRPLYFLKASAVACRSSCLKVWPALTLAAGENKATAGSGVQAAKLGSTTGPNGQRQVTYGGQPVYWFAFDNAKGKVKGNITDKWGKWTAVVVSMGSSTSGSGSSGTSTTGSSGGTSAGSGGASF